jgi:hypothetical protein
MQSSIHQTSFPNAQNPYPNAGYGRRTYPFPHPEGSIGTMPVGRPLSSSGFPVARGQAPSSQSALRRPASTSSPASSLPFSGLQNLVESLQVEVFYPQFVHLTDNSFSVEKSELKLLLRQGNFKLH